ncbi:10465_t:CDS:2, partial [Ambispora leptoticha]
RFVSFILKKDLIKDASAVSNFEVKHKRKALNIIDTWKQWTAPVKEGSRMKYELNQIYQKLEKQSRKSAQQKIPQLK